MGDHRSACTPVATVGVCPSSASSHTPSDPALSKLPRMLELGFPRTHLVLDVCKCFGA